MTAQANVFEARGRIREAMVAHHEPEVLLSGPAGTGKTRGWLEAINIIANKYAGARILFARKTKTALTQSVLVTWESHVKPNCNIGNVSRSHRSSYLYPNGSEIVCGGLDDPDKVLSTEYDIIYVNEATQITITDHENLSSRLRNGVVPYQRLVLDCNPDRPTHYLKKRIDSGLLKEFPSRHEENPRLFDALTQSWTPYGEAYIARLERLTGVRYKRLRLGLWAASEGMVYDNWDAARHVLEYSTIRHPNERFPYFEIPRSWRRIRVVDFGFNNPFVCQWFAIDPDGRMYLYRELYQTQLLVEDAAKRILEFETRKDGTSERIEATVCDHDAEGRATLERYLKCRTTAADKAITAGIQEVQNRLKTSDDGRARFFVMANALVERDSLLDEPEDGPPKPCGSLEEVDSYIYDPRDAKRELPVKQDDHGMDAWRYGVRYVDNRRMYIDLDPIIR